MWYWYELVPFGILGIIIIEIGERYILKQTFSSFILECLRKWRK